MCHTTMLMPKPKGMASFKRGGTKSQVQSVSGNAKWKTMDDSEKKTQILCSVKILSWLRKDLVDCILSDKKEQENETKQQDEPKKKQTPTRSTTRKRRKLGHEEPKDQ
ncbi:unnamed protein product [Cylindrotheca closterium]|uniref:Uncharacterized protein n=1 Tax=Cylindrotheca closterium TaxID=2856 RepID=A0AAD2CK87_9STRA|nr:unnamed protein product [Cylindrotheca closterium]